ncbi:MAG: methyltransferase family protein [Chthoniobacterales bacterium]
MDGIPALVSGCCLLVYWGAVVVKAQRARRWQHGANVIPPERIGRWLRIVWVPLVIAWCAQPWIVFAQNRHGTPLTHGIGILGAILCVFATTATFACWRAMGRSWRIGIDPAEKTELVIAGPFSLVRHPIYALSIVLMIGTVAAAQTRLMLALAIIHFVLMQWEASREEAHLLQKHGEEYARYVSTTGRFLPRI